MKLATLTAAILVSTISMGTAATPEEQWQLTKSFDDFDVLASPSVSTSDENGNGVARSK